jgi:uncharacterized protein (DUF952 family)
MTKVYKILSRAEWAAAKAQGVFEGSALDRKDGYIHLSTAAQAGETARLHFKGQADLVLLTLDAERLSNVIKWEPSRGGQLFPHLYGLLNPADVEGELDVPLNAEGWPDPGPLDPGVLVL